MTVVLGGTRPAATETDPARSAYDAFAPFYDAFTQADIRSYEGWTALLLPLAEEIGLRGRRVLDIGCGTGNSLLPFAERGWELTGCDISPNMLAGARAKLGDRATLIEHDMRTLPRVGEFDLIWSLSDCLTYLHTEQELLDTFAAFRRNLAPDGVVLFDFNTLATFRKFYSALMVYPTSDRVMILDGQASDELPSGGLAEAHVLALDKVAEDSWRRTRSVHFHRHHPEAVVRRALARAGLECVSVRGQAPPPQQKIEDTLDELRDFKAVYLARHAPETGKEG